MNLRSGRLLLLHAALLLTGCAYSSYNAPSVPSGSVADGRMHGLVHGGQQPVGNATVTVWLAGTSGYGTGATALASTTTDASGEFSFASGSYTCPFANAPVYITAQGGNPGSGLNANLMLAASLGSCSAAQTATVDLTEVTTVATAYALSHFFTETLGGAPATDLFGGPAAGSGTYHPGLVLANSSTVPMLADVALGVFNESSAYPAFTVNPQNPVIPSGPANSGVGNTSPNDTAISGFGDGPIPAGPNLALGTSAVSTGDEAGEPPAAALDGDLTTRWSSAFMNASDLTIDLGSEKQVGQVVLRWERAYGAQYQIRVSTDGQNFTPVFTQTAGMGGLENIVFPAVGARYVQFYGMQRATEYGYSFFEMEVYGPVPSSAVTIESAKLYSAANTLAACVNSTGELSATETTSACGRLFAWTTPPGGARPADTLQAAVQMALYPYQNVSSLFNLAAPGSPYVGLNAAPNDWTAAVSYNSAAFGLAISGTATTSTSSTLDIDASGKVWFPTNTAAAHGLAYFDPVSASFNGPYGTALNQPQYVAIDSEGMVWGSDLAANQLVGVMSTAPASVVVKSTPTDAVTGPLAVTTGTNTDGLLFSSIAAAGSSLYQDQGGALTLIGSYTETPSGLATYTLGDTSFQEGDVASSGSQTTCRLEARSTQAGFSKVFASTTSTCTSGGIAQIDPNEGESVSAASSLNLLCSYNAGTCFAPAVPLASPEGLAVDGDSHVWIANAGNGSVSVVPYAFATGSPADYGVLSPIAYKHDASNGGTMGKPYGIAIDGSGNVWVSNASCVTTGATACTPSGGFTLTELIGAAAPTSTPLSSSVLGVTIGTRPQMRMTTHARAQTHTGRTR